MPLFQVQDPDRPMFVIAADYADAIEQWSELVKRENDDEEGDPPAGVSLICDDDDLMVYGQTPEQVTGMQDEIADAEIIFRGAESAWADGGALGANSTVADRVRKWRGQRGIAQPRPDHLQ